MTTREILNDAGHRPWPMPKAPWKFYQEWNRAIFLHWEVDYDELKKLVPANLEIDLIEGKPWVSLVAFTMEKIRPRYLPAFKPISDFDEVNVRTYVKFANKTGVYFLSIEGGKKLSCQVAKSISQLPYRYSKITRSQNQYKTHNAEFDDRLDIQFHIEESIEKKSVLDEWLTERYALFQDFGKAINAFDIQHIQWPMNNIRVENLDVNYPRFKALFSGYPDKIHYSEGVQVIAWGKQKVLTQ
ncbi:DUF2071 domain-containing protein [Fulvivirgaceae bacterium BMA12]|uniref:DUF2071 domain-containing protein n=1 Tax=Agaribacillus aureus TaxID=3051825 RepID=A0ABT8L3X3_9BACT|nr:DUF2071 domain-containing protein [Fulvivirgaceae bacterium BMA12]